MEKYMHNLSTAMTNASPMLALSLTVVLIAIGLGTVLLLTLFAAWVFSHTGVGILVTIPILAAIRVGYALWTGK